MIGAESYRLCRDLDRKGMALSIDHGTCRLDRSADQRGEVSRLYTQHESSARDAGDVKQILEQHRHVLDLTIDHLVAPALLSLGCARRLRDECCLANRSEGIAKLVRQGCEKFILAAIGLTERRLRAA